MAPNSCMVPDNKACLHTAVNFSYLSKHSVELVCFLNTAVGKHAIAKASARLTPDRAAQCSLCRWSSKGRLCPAAGLTVLHGA